MMAVACHYEPMHTYIHAYAYETMALQAPLMYLLSEKETLRCNPLCSSTNQKRTEIKVATTKITDDFRYEWKPSHAYHKIDTFHGEKRNTKEGTGKSM